MSKKNGAALMFDEEAVRGNADYLPRLIRIIFYGNAITNDGYIARYWRYFKVLGGKTRKMFTQDTSADRKVLLDRDKLTFNKMRHVLTAMGYDIECVSIRIKDRMSGEVRTFSTDDTVEQLKEYLERDRQIGIQSL